MRCRTHIVSANALMLLSMNPTTPKELLVTIGTCTIGSIISDLDVRTSEAHKVVDVVTLIAFSSVLVSYILDLKYGYNIFSTVKNGDYYFPIVGMLLLLLISFYGSHQPHRSFMHSILGVLMLTGTVYCFFGRIWIPFLIGIISHIILDLLNKKNIRLLYPSKKGICLKLCEYGGTVDKIIFFVSIVMCILLLFIL